MKLAGLYLLSAAVASGSWNGAYGLKSGDITARNLRATGMSK
jgi:hypothetical protein